jgi:hypothetical protein
VLSLQSLGVHREIDCYNAPEHIVPQAINDAFIDTIEVTLTQYARWE